MLPYTSKAVEVTFNKVSKGTVNSHDAYTNNVPIATVFPITFLNFISVDPSLSLLLKGNDVSGNFQYLDGLGVTQTVFGSVPRQFKNGSAIEGFHFVPTVPTTGILTCDAQVFLFTIGTTDGKLVFREAHDFEALGDSENINTCIF